MADSPAGSSFHWKRGGSGEVGEVFGVKFPIAERCNLVN